MVFDILHSEFYIGGCINIWGGVINKAGPKSHLGFYNQYKNCPPAQTKYWKHFDVQVQLTDRPRLPYIQAVFDFLISYQPWVKINVTSKVLLETARLASVLPIAPPRQTTGPIQVEDTQSFFGSQPALLSAGRKTCAANRKLGPGDFLINQLSLISW